MNAAARYDSAYRLCDGDPENYWRNAAREIDWDVAPEAMFDATAGPYGHWFPDARLNVAANCLDRHVAAGRGAQPALIWDSPMVGEVVRYTYAELTEQVAQFAGALVEVGVGIGDRVLIYMPMIPEAVIAMLASARIGAIHSVVFGGFAPAELAARIRDAAPRVIVTATGGIEPGRVIAYPPLVAEALVLSGHAVSACFVARRPQIVDTTPLPGLRDFADAAARAAPAAPVSVDARHPLYILYTSGTTGKPKGIVRDSGGYAVALLESLRTIYGLRAGDTMFTASDIGWVVGHSYIVYAPLLAGCTTILYEGKPVRTPDSGALWRVCSDHGADLLFTAPTAIRAIRQTDEHLSGSRRYDLSRLAAIFLAGERCDPATAQWLSTGLDKPVIDHWWQTETGWPITSGFRGLGLVDLPEGSGGRAAPGWRVAVADEQGGIVERDGTGALVLGLPLPPGAASTLWNDDTGFSTSYLREIPGWYTTGDAGLIDGSGNVWIMGRTDDIINIAGHRLSTGAMEEVIAGHPDVVECAVVGLADAIKGQVPVALFVQRPGASEDALQMAEELIALVRDRIGAVAALREALPVGQLPKTRSGKILRKVIRAIGDGELPVIPSTIDDMSAVHALSTVFRLRATSKGLP